MRLSSCASAGSRCAWCEAGLGNRCLGAGAERAGGARRGGERDRSDRTREISPLYAAADAVLLDTTDRSVPAVVREVLEVVQSQLTATA